MGILSWLGRGSTKESEERNESKAGPSKPSKASKPAPQKEAAAASLKTASVKQSKPTPSQEPQSPRQRNAAAAAAKKDTSTRHSTRATVAASPSAKRTGGSSKRDQPQSQAQKKKQSQKTAAAPSATEKRTRGGASKASEKKRRRVETESEPSSAPSTSSEEEEEADVEEEEEQRPSSSSDEDSSQKPSADETSAGAAPSTAAAPGAGIKRVRSLWRMRPIVIDEKLRVFVEGRDDELLHYDGGEFYAWLKDCETGVADPDDGFSYPLTVQDSEFRTVVEIKGPEHRLPAPPPKRQRTAPGGAGGSASGIRVPTFRALPEDQLPEKMLETADPRELQIVHRTAGSNASGESEAPVVAAKPYRPPAPIQPPQIPGWPAGEAALLKDPPFIRFVQPTPDDLDLSLEYDLDEEDEEWLVEYNAAAKQSKARNTRRPLGEEWMEHLIDRLEKEYTAELQRHPEKWVMTRGEGQGGLAEDNGSEPVPIVTVPPIEEVLPLDRVLEIPGMNHYESVIRAVYDYWRAKHRRAGRPLIQRLWYEPPWHRGAAARHRAADTDANEDEHGHHGGGVFVAPDSPVALQGIRKRRMDATEVRNRFESIRRDLEGARTLADLVRRREKLKRREAALLAEEWQSRMRDIAAGRKIAVIKGGQLKNPPPEVHALRALSRAAMAQAQAAASTAAILGFDPYDTGEVMPTNAENRAARLAARRDARDAARDGGGGGGYSRPPTASGAAADGGNASRSARNRGGIAAASRHNAGAGGIGSTTVRGPKPARGVRRQEHCVWCGGKEPTAKLLGCGSCHRCFCARCFQRRPGYGLNDWNRAVRDEGYECVFCRGLEEDDEDDEDDGSQFAEDDDGKVSRRAVSRSHHNNNSRKGGNTPSAAVAARVASGSKSAREQARAQAAAQPRGPGGRFMPFSPATAAALAAAEAEEDAEQEDDDEQEDSDVADVEDKEGDSSSSSSSESETSSSSEDDSDTEDDVADGVVGNGKQKAQSKHHVSSSSSESDTSSSDEDDSSDSDSSDGDDEGGEEVAAAQQVANGHHASRGAGQGRGKENLSPLRRAGGGDGGRGSGGRGEKSTPAAAPSTSGGSQGKKVSRELASLLTRKSRSLMRQEAKTTSSQKPTRNGGVKKSAGGSGTGSGSSSKSKSKNKKRSGGGASRADIEIVLQQAVTTPSRKLRSSH